MIDRPARALLLALLVAGCPAANEGKELAAAPTIDTLPNGAVRIINHGPTEWADTNGWKLVLDYTLAPPAGSPGELMQPQGIAIRADGHLLVGDNAPVQAKLFGPGGAFIRNIGREGDGPGEYRSVNPAWIGDTILIEGQNRGVTFTMTGEPIATFQGVCCVAGPQVKVDARNRIRLTGSGTFVPGRFAYRWIWLTALGERLDSMDIPSAGDGPTWQIKQGSGGVATYGIPFAGYSNAETLHDGRIVYGFTTAYSLVLSTSGADTVAMFGRDDAVPVAIPDSMRRAMIDRMEEIPGYISGARLEDIPTSYPLWSELTEDGQGNIWVGTPGPTGTTAAFDVYTPDGRLRGSVPVPWGRAWQTFWRGDRVAVLDLDEDDLPRVRVYRIQR